jgi:hypothetical protein
MRYAQSGAAQRRAFTDDLLHLRDIADQSISIKGYERRRSHFDNGAFLLLTVFRQADPEQREVKVVTSAAIVVEQVREFFEENPTETLECVVTKRRTGEDREYWLVVDQDEYERERATRTEGSSRVAATAE